MSKKKLKQLMVPACVMAAVVLLCLLVLYIIQRKGWSLASVELSVETCLNKFEIKLGRAILHLLNRAKEKITRSPEKEKRKQKMIKKKRKAKKKNKGKKKGKNKKIKSLRRR
ncbi:hypothetical protein [Peptoniphilus sp. EMRHCC_23]|uniref:hypothetical protein n=1 Tax=Peptoniphilus rachelemmaiella TaxID=2811779 RepID=UPI001C004809|nr:hypothetical protein [Peptoniphilus rachelemmaiella]